MKIIYRTTIALCITLAILFLTIGSAAAPDVVEYRCPTYHELPIDEIFPDDNGEAVTIDATQFAAFYYDVDDELTIEPILE